MIHTTPIPTHLLARPLLAVPLALLALACDAPADHHAAGEGAGTSAAQDTDGCMPDSGTTGASDSDATGGGTEQGPSLTAAGHCAVAAAVVAECSEDAATLRACDDAFVAQCESVGTFVPTTPVPTTTRRRCSSTSDLEPGCSAAFSAACQEEGGIFVHPDADADRGLCILPTPSLADSYGLSEEGVAFLAGISSVSVASVPTPGASMVEATLSGHEGETLGTFRVEMDGTDVVLDATFADGSLTVVSPVNLDGACMPAQIMFTGDLDASTARQRAAILELVAPSQVQPGFLGCVASLAVGVGACSPPSVATGVGAVACGGSALAAACTCFEKEIEEEFGDVC